LPVAGLLGSGLPKMGEGAVNRTLALGIALVVVGAGPPPAGRTPEAQARLDKYLTGRVAGEPQRCIKAHSSNDPIGIDDRTMLFRDGPRLWRNELVQGYRCDQLGLNRMLVTVNKSIQLCSGDTTYIVDIKSGNGEGTCVLGPFVPYARP
jgi:hypothetical protein